MERYIQMVIRIVILQLTQKGIRGAINKFSQRSERGQNQNMSEAEFERRELKRPTQVKSKNRY